MLVSRMKKAESPALKYLDLMRWPTSRWYLGRNPLKIDTNTDFEDFNNRQSLLQVVELL